METVGAILQGISAVLGGWLMIQLVYQLFLTFFGFTRKTKDYQDHDPQSRFLVLVPAHNEERVIRDIIENLQQMDYPEELYDFYIIADNCTDRTAEVARNLGAKVIETRKESPDAPTGKPIALKKALERLGNYEKQYDLLMIFDADNLIDRNMFREVNSQFLDRGRPDLIQCYLGCKNKEGIIPWYYYITFTVSNRFVQLAKHRLHLNCGVGGTGFAISTSYLHERGGWTSMSLTEDLEIQVEAILSGRRILWNHNVRVYDEKPVTLMASIRQQIRWGQGRWYVFIRNFVPCFRALFTGKISFWEFLSVFTCMAGVSCYVAILLQLIVSALLLIPAFGAKVNPFAMDLPSTVWSLLLFAYSYLGVFYVADWLDNGVGFSLRSIPKMIAGMTVNIIVCVVNQVVGLIRFRHQQNWVKTEHSLTRSSAQSELGTVFQKVS